MNEESDPLHDDSELVRALRSLFGDQADAIVQQMRDAGFDPADLEQTVGSIDPMMMQAAMRQFEQFFTNASDDAVNTNISHDIARQVTAAAGSDPTVTDAESRAVGDAFRVAELWLDVATDFLPATAKTHAWSRAEWVEATISTWNALTEPVAQAVVDALVTLLANEAADQIGSADQIGPADQMLRSMGAAVFGMQVGQATGELASEVFGTTDIGVPLVAQSGGALVVRNVLAFADGLDIGVRDVMQFLALREAAAVRLFSAVPWLRAHVLGLIEAYARGVNIDIEALEDNLRDIDPMDTDQLRSALSQGVFSVTSTEAQKATLERLETALALVEGWVDAVSFDASRAHLSNVVALREMMRRRRAAGGPAEQTFATLVGLELRPRRAREATRLWELVQLESDIATRDRVWAHPDLLPTGNDLDNPEDFVSRWLSDTAGSDVDAELSALLDQEENRDDG